jgi:hypothetical protein
MAYLHVSLISNKASAFFLKQFYSEKGTTLIQNRPLISDL